MQGTSRESFAAAQDRLESLLRQQPAAARAAVGDALFAVTQLLDANAGLRRALTDPSRQGADKAALVSRLLTGQVPDDVVDLVAGVARARWSRARDVADATDLLARSSVLAAAQAEGRLDTVEDELFRFGRTVYGAPELRDVLTDRTVAGERKAALVEDLLRGKVAAETLRLVRQAVLAPRGSRLDALLDEYGRIAAERREQRVAHVVVASPLDESQRDRLVAALSRLQGHPVHLNVDVDPGVLGGIRVEIGDEVLDGTVSRRLEDARRALAG
ncbi:MAG TPA: F0F1 ATP synthase subunit delta [Actinomycetales bacterium]|nr:F0F1 ATP synthase subunit delta [Actinomycetales bacterium]